MTPRYDPAKRERLVRGYAEVFMDRPLLDAELWKIVRDARGNLRRSPEAAANVAASLAGGAYVETASVRPTRP